MVKVPLLRVIVAPLPLMVRLRSIVGNAALRRYVQPARSTSVASAAAFAMAWLRPGALHGTVTGGPAGRSAASAALPPSQVTATAATARPGRHAGNAGDRQILVILRPVLRI
jgi:hypothetical protein